jgi:hypothetical protein
MRVSGRVEGVRSRRQGLVIELRGGLVLNIHEADLPAFRPLRLEALPGHEVEALGWVHRGKGGASMRLRHPSGLMLDRSPP